VNPGAVRLLRCEGEDTAGLRSKSWTEFAAPEGTPIDIVITVCGSAAGEACPVFPGRAVRAHWGLDDPAAVTGTEGEVDAAFARTWSLLHARVEAFLALPFETMGDAELSHALSEIGAMQGAA
jgi:arsenate reductase